MTERAADAVPVAPERTPLSIAKASVRLARPKQWTKNGLLFAALVFSPREWDLHHAAIAVLGFVAFSMLASAGYVLNDFLDRAADRHHPRKRHRPLASGAMPVGLGLAQMLAMLVLGVAIGAYLGPWFLGVALLYLANTVSYSLYVKHIPILDVMFLAGCYVWRAVGGAVVIGVHVSEWFFLCTAFLALFIGFNKRRAELSGIGEGQTRKVLSGYSLQMLDQYQAITTGSVVLCYALYTVLGSTPWMVVTIPLVLFGIFRYIYLVDQKGEGGAPDETFLKDWPILLTVLLYVVAAGVVMYLHSNGLLTDWRAPSAFIPGHVGA